MSTMSPTTARQFEGFFIALKHGSPAALRELGDRVRNRFIRMATAMLRHGDPLRRHIDVEDIVQDAIARLLAKLPELQLKSGRDLAKALNIFMRRAFRDLARTYLGRKGCAPRPSCCDISAFERTDDLPKGLVALEDPCEVEMWATHAEAIGRLPEDECEVYSLRFYHEMTYNEIANLTGLSIDQVRSRLCNAGRKLGRVLGPWFDNEEQVRHEH